MPCYKKIARHFYCDYIKNVVALVGNKKGAIVYEAGIIS